MDVLIKVEELLNATKFVKDGEWKASEIDFLNSHSYLTAKPIVYLINISEEDYFKKKNPWLPRIQKWIMEHGGGPMVPYSAEYEAKIVAFGVDNEVRKKGAEELGAPSCINRIIKVGYSTLKLIHYFTAGEDEVKCWTIRAGTKAPGAAGVIHTDFERGFICAEIMTYADLERLGSELAVKAEGLYKQKGKEYEVEDGDIIYFKFNVTAQPKKMK
jgi:ribosome-binding ATPase YchF (GTP1/OBG family)